MRFRVGVALGFAAGYVLGSKAGRDRYEQIVSATKDVVESDRGKQVTQVAQKVAEQATHAVEVAREKVQSEVVSAPIPEPESIVVPEAEPAAHGEGNGKL